LRSETSLIQTAGRASRNVLGRVLLYADRVTGSMQRAIAEMNRRRTTQVEFNRANGIVPASIRKEVRSLLAPEETAASGDLSVEGLGKRWKDKLPLLLANLEEEMHLASERLDFEEAARIRDRIRQLSREADPAPNERVAGRRRPY
jgi:excinuclease ABC subunit B